MHDAKPIVWIALAFVVGAILPALGLLAGAAAVGYWYASARPHNRAATPEVLDIIRDVERREKQKRLK